MCILGGEWLSKLAVLLQVFFAITLAAVGFSQAQIAFPGELDKPLLIYVFTASMSSKAIQSSRNAMALRTALPCRCANISAMLASLLQQTSSRLT